MYVVTRQIQIHTLDGGRSVVQFFGTAYMAGGSRQVQINMLDGGRSVVQFVGTGKPLWARVGAEQ